MPLFTVLAEGDPTPALVQAARTAGLLALGIRGRSRAAGLLPGSVSQACAASASGPVVLVKRSGDAQAGPRAAIGRGAGRAPWVT